MVKKPAIFSTKFAKKTDRETLLHHVIDYKDGVLCDLIVFALLLLVLRG